MGNNTPGEITDASVFRKKLAQIIMEEIQEHTHKWYTFGCKDATYLMSKAEYASLSLSEKCLLKFHKLICKYCRRYKDQMDKITRFFKTSSESNRIALTSQKKEALNQLITETLKK